MPGGCAGVRKRVRSKRLSPPGLDTGGTPKGSRGCGSPTAPGTSGAPGTQVYCSPPSSSLPAEQDSVNSTLLSHNPKSWVPEQGLIQRAPQPMAGLHSPALLPPWLLSPPQQYILGRVVFPQLRITAGRSLPSRLWQAHAAVSSARSYSEN